MNICCNYNRILLIIFLVLLIGIPTLFGVTYSNIANIQVNNVSCSVSDFKNNLIIPDKCTVLSSGNNIQNNYYGYNTYCPKNYNKNNQNDLYTCYIYNINNINIITGSQFFAQYSTNSSSSNSWIGILFFAGTMLFVVYSLILLVIIIIGIANIVGYTVFKCYKENKNILPVSELESDLRHI
jgi:hypothetical protein